MNIFKRFITEDLVVFYPIAIGFEIRLNHKTQSYTQGVSVIRREHCITHNTVLRGTQNKRS
jgi:hypothetical protein